MGINLLLVLALLTSIIVAEPVENNATTTTTTTTLKTKKLPQAIIIGAKKCGTRALLKFIGAHPNVTTAGAETHFFDRFYHMGLDWYR